MKSWSQNFGQGQKPVPGSILITGQVETWSQILLKERNLFPVRSSSPNRWKPDLKILTKGKNMSPVRSSSPNRWKPGLKFYLRIETCSLFDLNHRTKGNLTLSYSKNKNPVRSSSPNKWKPGLKFYPRIETCSLFNLNHQMRGNLTLSYSKNKNPLPGSILIPEHMELTSNYSRDWNWSLGFNLNHGEGNYLTLNIPR